LSKKELPDHRMKDTHFFLPASKASRLTPVYGASEDGENQDD
jgi:hypothetical protein